MQHDILSTPSDEMILPPPFQAKIDRICWLARLSGFWKRPFKRAAASYEEMTFWDICYWFYRNKNPIKRPQRPLKSHGKSAVSLPEGFEQTNTVTIGAAGDLIQSDTLKHSKDVLYESVADLLFEQDVSYASLELPISAEEPERLPLTEKACPTDYSTIEQFESFKGHKGKNFTVLHTATNHMYDTQVEGVETTQRILAQSGIIDVGTNTTPDEYGKAVVITKNGIKIGFASAGFGLNGHELPTEEGYRIHNTKLVPKSSKPDLDILKHQIEDAKQKGCDFIIASLHWGYEFEFFPRESQIETAHQLIEWGADALIGHHPHVIQPLEYYRTKRDPERMAVIAYSLGSLAWTFSAPHLLLSSILNLSLAKGRVGTTERTYIESVNVTPVFRRYFEKEGLLYTKIEKLKDHLNKNTTSKVPEGQLNQLKYYADLVLSDYD